MKLLSLLIFSLLIVFMVSLPYKSEIYGQTNDECCAACNGCSNDRNTGNYCDQDSNDGIFYCWKN